jgi:tetratricopeptide (TPR) repeat protein
LRALGRFEDALSLYAEALAVRSREENWLLASKNASNLAEVELVLARLTEALQSAEDSRTFALRCNDIGQQIYALTTLAEVQHQAGKIEDAASNFEMAELLHIRHVAGRGHPMRVLYRLPGIRYGRYLLDRGEVTRVLDRAQFLATSGPDISNEETACGQILIADAVRLAHAAGAVVNDYGDALRYVNDALVQLRSASSEVYLPYALLVRSRIHAALQDSKAALQDAERALVVARRNHAVLFVIDAQIEMSRIALGQGNLDGAAHWLEDAKAQVQAVGYERRTPDIVDIKARL